MQISVYHPYSFGIVAAAKGRDTDIIEVTPIEVIPFIDGEIKPDRALIEDKGVDAEGNPYVVETQTDRVIEAEWLPIHNTNRFTSPDVQVGEYVEL